jgi:hypothetical protein
MTTDGWLAFFERIPEWEWRSASDYRHRHIMALGKALTR